MAAVVPEHPLPQAADRQDSLTGEGHGENLAAYWRPPYWTTWLFLLWLRFAAVLPWRLAIGLHKKLGRAAGALLPGRRRIVRRNLEMCFPQLQPHEIDALTGRHFENLGALLAETAIAWFGSADRMAHLFRIEGVEHLHAALAKGKGVVLFSGHFTTLEICVPVIKSLVPLYAFMFRARRNPLLNAIQSRGRRRTAHASFANNDVRAMLRMLRKNAVVWYAPDQATRSGGELLPFFGEPAMTSTAASRLALVSGAAVVPLFFCRLPDDSGYVLRFQAPLDNLPSGDAVRDTSRLTAVLEDFVRECPEQYFWIHRKFKGRPAELPNAYDRADAPTRTPSRSTIRDLAATPVAIVAVSLFIVALDNDSFWNTVLHATMLDEHQGAILLSLFAIMFCTLNIALSLAPGGRVLKIVAMLLLLVSATSGFFMSEYGIVIDPSMIRNIVETEVREASPLLTGSFFYHLTIFGIVPALALAFTPLGAVGWKRHLAARAGLIALNVLAVVGAVYANYGAVSFFAHQNHAVRLFMNPGYPLYSYARFLGRADDEAPTPSTRIALDVHRSAAYGRRQKPVLTIFVLGETARSDRFSFNGYRRDTNRYTRARGVVDFAHVTSCGTSTADSVPCIFSGLGRAGFTHAAAAAHESLFALLQRLGVGAFWRDNSTGCKDVCDPQHFEQFATRTDPVFCDSTGCFDEILLEGIENLVADRTRDQLIVLHQRGSHGPAYHTDTPAWSKEFRPECDLPNLRNCSTDSINNAYDNTILYTDYFVSRVIDFLEGQAEAFDVAMIYVSDHGESLGENGLYLHGFPYAIAPQEQTRVPMLLWGSPGFYARNHIERSCLEQRASRDYSHDSVFHTLLAIYDIESPVYVRELDLLASCRNDDRSQRHDPRS